MLSNDHVETYVAANILPQTQIRRLANGSIDYTFYDRRAHFQRSLDVCRLAQAVKTAALRVIARWLGGDAAYLPARPAAADPLPIGLARRAGSSGRPARVGTSPGSYPRAA